MIIVEIRDFSIHHWKLIAGATVVGVTVAVGVCVHQHYRRKRDAVNKEQWYQRDLSIPLEVRDRLSEVTPEEIELFRSDIDRRYNHLLMKLGVLMENDQMAFLTGSSTELKQLIDTQDPFELSGTDLVDHLNQERRRNLVFCAATRHQRVPVLAKLVRTEDYNVEQILQTNGHQRRPHSCFIL